MYVCIDACFTIESVIYAHYHTQLPKGIQTYNRENQCETERFEPKGEGESYT